MRRRNRKIFSILPSWINFKPQHWPWFFIDFFYCRLSFELHISHMGFKVTGNNSNCPFASVECLFISRHNAIFVFDIIIWFRAQTNYNKRKEKDIKTIILVQFAWESEEEVIKHFMWISHKRRKISNASLEINFYSFDISQDVHE